MKKSILTLGAILIATLTQIHAEQEELRYVIDGDTVVFSHTTCRLAFIDTPESKPNQKARKDIQGNRDVSVDDVVHAGRLSKNYLKSIMQKGRSYEFDVMSVDHYGRSVCVIYDEGHSINDNIVRNGFAVPFWSYIPNNKKQDMINLVRRANNNNKGLWRANRPVMEMMNHGGSGEARGSQRNQGYQEDQRGNNGYMDKARNFMQGMKESYRENMDKRRDQYNTDDNREYENSDNRDYDNNREYDNQEYGNSGYDDNYDNENEYSNNEYDNYNGNEQYNGESEYDDQTGVRARSVMEVVMKNRILAMNNDYEPNYEQ